MRILGGVLAIFLVFGPPKGTQAAGRWMAVESTILRLLQQGPSGRGSLLILFNRYSGREAVMRVLYPEQDSSTWTPPPVESRGGPWIERLEELFRSLDGENITEEVAARVITVHLRQSESSPVSIEDFFREDIDWPYLMRKENFDTLEGMLEAGLNPNIKGSDGFTGLYHAIKKGNHPAAEMLLFYGAEPNAILLRDGSERPLALAVRRNDLPMVETLLRYGADSLPRERGGSSAYELAPDYGGRPMIDLLDRYLPWRERRKQNRPANHHSSLQQQNPESLALPDVPQSDQQ